MRLSRLWTTTALAGILCSLPALAAWQTLGKVEHVQPADDALVLTTASGAALRISFVSADVVRIRMSPKGTFGDDFSYAVETNRAANEIKVRDEGRSWSCAVPAGSASGYAAATDPEIHDADGTLLTDDPARPMAFDTTTGAIDLEARSPFELYYGFGERLAMSRHQQYMTMWNSDTPGYAPGLIHYDNSVLHRVEPRGARRVLRQHVSQLFRHGNGSPRYIGAAGGELTTTPHRPRAQSGQCPARLHRLTNARTRGQGAGHQQSRYSYTPIRRSTNREHVSRQTHPGRRDLFRHRS